MSEITLAQCKAATTPKRAGSLVSRAVTMGAKATVSAAYAIYAADVTGYLKETGSGTVAAQFGWKSQSRVTELKTIGYAMVVLGLKPDSELFDHLNRAGAGYSDVRQAIYAEGATLASVETALRKRVTPDGKRIPKDDSARPDDGSKADKGTDKPRSQDVTLATDPGKRVDALIKLLARSVGDLTPEQFDAAKRRLADIVRAETALRDKMNGTGKATPVTVAKTVARRNVTGAAARKAAAKAEAEGKTVAAALKTA